jgi:hypothetical protein
MPGDFVAPSLSVFQRELQRRLKQLFLERWESDAIVTDYKKRPKRRLVLPVGLFLVVDDANGGDITAQELVKRFNILHINSENAIDFYFLGWEWNEQGNRDKGIHFDPQSLQECRKALKLAGVKTSGSNAELILVDAVFEATLHGFYKDGSGGIWSPSEITLNFKSAIYVNLSKSREEENLPPLGDFLQSIIAAAQELVEVGKDPNYGVVFSISDKLGLATAKQSFLDFIYETWGKIIGAKKLSVLAVRDVGPAVNLDALGLKAISASKP